MNKQPIYLVAGARPNFIKLAPLVRELRNIADLPYQIIHTGQHYDYAMSGTFFNTLGIPAPDVNLEVGSGEQGLQTARILERFEHLLIESPPSAVVVFGDVNSTVACALAASKLQIPVAHVEAGLRSFDRTMPEEINRLVTDVLSDFLFASEDSGVYNLSREGISAYKVHLVGNIMIDSLMHMMPVAEKRDTLARLGLRTGEYALLTMHRPSNVDNKDILKNLVTTIAEISLQLPVVFPVHPRTDQRLQELNIQQVNPDKFRLVEPLGYLDSLCLQKNARIVFTDSGGMQEETTFLDIPCITLRDNTERPVTVDLGTSTLVGNDPQRIWQAFERVISGNYKHAGEIPLWDGKSAYRISSILRNSLAG